MAIQVMEGDIQVLETQRVARRPSFAPIRWAAIFAGLVSGLASYMLLSLLGVAIGLTAVDPQAVEPVGSVPLATGIWTGVSMLVGAFIGGYVAGHMSGLFRLADGMLHGFVAWASTTILFAVLTTTALGAVLGGTFRILGQGIGTGTQAAATASSEGGTQNMMDRLASLITGGGEGNVTAESLSAVQQRLAANDRQGAINVMVNEMGFTEERANQAVDRMMPLFGPQGEQQVRDAADRATTALTAASWWLFFGLLLSLGLGVLGGSMGTRATGNRLLGDHLDERTVKPISNL